MGEMSKIEFSIDDITKRNQKIVYGKLPNIHLYPPHLDIIEWVIEGGVTVTCLVCHHHVGKTNHYSRRLLAKFLKKHKNCGFHT